MKCTIEELSAMRQNMPIVDCAKELGVSRATLCNWLKEYGLSTPRKLVTSQLTSEQLEIINGSLLGDGYLDNRGDYNSRFNKVQCIYHHPYLRWMYDKLEPFSLNIVDQWTPVIKRVNNKIISTKAKRLQKKYYTVTHKIFSNLRNKWYVNGIKIIPKDLQLTPLTIAVWFMDDGTANHDKRNARFHTDSFSRIEIEQLIEYINGFGICSRVWKHYNKFDIGVSGKNYDLLMNLLSNHVILDCFKRKIK